MPLILTKEIHGSGSLWLWHIKEEEVYFIHRLELEFENLSEINNWAATRRLEWLSGRYLIWTYLGYHPREILIDEYGKPHLPDSNQNFNLSHSGNFIGLYKDNKSCGLDIQMFKKSIDRIAHKFCAPGDIEQFSSFGTTESFHFIWAIKEAVYKAYGLREIDFKRDIKLYGLEWVNGILKIKAVLSKNSQNFNYTIEIKKIGQLYMAHTI